VLVRVAQSRIQRRRRVLVLPLVPASSRFLEPCLIISRRCGADSRLVGIFANYRLVGIFANYDAILDPKMGSVASEAAIAPSQTTRLVRRRGRFSVRAVSACSASAIGGVTFAASVSQQGAFGLTSVDQNVAVEGLTIDRATRNLADGVDLVFRHLHRTKNLLKLAALISSAQVMDNRMLGIVPPEDGHETAIQAIDQRVANTLGETRIPCERAHRIHHALEIDEHRRAHTVPFAIDVALADMLQRRLRLVGISGAEFIEHRSANLMPGELQDLSVNLRSNPSRVRIDLRQVEVG